MKTERMTTAAGTQAEGIRYEAIHYGNQRDAMRAAREATLAGLLDVEVVVRPAPTGPVWGYAFTARPATGRWVIEGSSGEWLSEEQAANSIEALAIYHATGGVNGFFAHPVRQEVAAGPAGVV